MKSFKYLVVMFLCGFVLSCGSGVDIKKNDFVVKTNTKKGHISNNKVLNLSIDNKKSHKIDSVAFSTEGNKLSTSTNLAAYKLGKHIIDATVYSNGKAFNVNTNITVLSSKAPKIYKYKLLNTYPHDITSYTQGLEFYKGHLYESTGLYKKSKLRQVNYKTGAVIKNVDLNDSYFGEGLTVLNNNIYQLTWESGLGFVYDVTTLEKKNSFKYGKSKEGWGLCNNGKTIFKSDGTEKIWSLNTTSLTEDDHIEVYTNKGKIIGINEMEWVNGSIYANRYQKDGVAIINPKNGTVDGVIDFSPLKKLVTQHDELDVLNGIAYNPTTKTLFITGKLWDKLFEVQILD